MILEHVGALFTWLTRGCSRGLLGLGLRPNHVTVVGMLLTVGAGVALAAGRAGWPVAAGLIVAAGGCDMLDGTMATLGGLKSRLGGIVDSVADRVSDAALYLGPLVYFARQPDAGGPPNLTLMVLAGAGLTWAYLISYIRARAECEVVFAGGGFWQRGERVVTILLGTLFGHVTTAVWILGLWPLTTVAHRAWRAGAACRLVREGRQGEVEGLQPRGLWKVVLWGHPRGGVPFDLHAGAVILLLVFVDVPAVDPLGLLVARLGGA